MKIRHKKYKLVIQNKQAKFIKIKYGSNNKFKSFLTRNKIYFETIMMLAVSIAGIIVSIVGVNVAITSNNISLEEKKIENLEKQPAFIYDTETDSDKITYFIKNVGGNIKYGNIFGDEVLIISIYNKNFDYIGKGYIYLDGYFKENFSTYDFETNRFELYSNMEPKPIINWINKIQQLINAEGYFCGIECTKYFDLIYTDYKQETIQKTMILQNRRLCDITGNDKNEFKIHVNLNNFDDTQINNDIKEQLQLLVKYSDN